MTDTAPTRCDWCAVATEIPGSHWHPTSCGQMAAEDVARLSPVARRIYEELPR